MYFYSMTGTPEVSKESGFMEKQGIKPATPGLQGIGLSPTPFCGFLGYKPVCWVGLRFVLVL